METRKTTKRCVSMKLVLPRKKKYNDESDANVKNNRLLITVNVVGSSGPLRFLVNEDDKVFNVIDLSLKLYARGGRLPVLGSDIKSFMLYASDGEPSGALNSFEEIGFCGGRNFLLYKKSNNQVPEAKSRMITQPHSGRWKFHVKENHGVQLRDLIEPYEVHLS